MHTSVRACVRACVDDYDLKPTALRNARRFRLLFTYEALLGVPWVLLLDYWNLIMWKY